MKIQKGKGIYRINKKPWIANPRFFIVKESIFTL